MAFKAELLKKKLKEEGKTRDELVADLKKQGCPRHKRTVSRWLAGDNPPKAKDLEALARALNCKPQDFDPFFADIGLGEVSIQAHVSTASHNAYELMRVRYGVSQKQIMELAPVLFAILAAHALKVPDQDDALDREARMNGRPSTQTQSDWIDRQASQLRKCFGLKSRDHNLDPRNLFDTAVQRLSAQASEYVSAEWYVGAAPGDVPGAAGYITDTELLAKITGDDGTLVEAIVKGRIRLSSVLQEVKERKEGASVEGLANALRQAHEARIEGQRAAGLKKLKAWREFYAARHPGLAEEYDALVTQHCHEEGWYPDRYTDDDRIQSWVNPSREDRHINEDTLVEYQRMKAARTEDGTMAFVLPFQDPVYRRFEALQHHRAQLRKQFEETWS
ncbi:helix-turn-helix domain-containing protein [Rhodobacter xanthinilyticus]|nr:helix-turn-helix transcriptional regulator [Rhodobacter xanthinilyticus]